MDGLIVKALSGFYYVQRSDGSVLRCRARGKFRKTGISAWMIPFSTSFPPMMRDSDGEMAVRLSRISRMPFRLAERLISSM